MTPLTHYVVVRRDLPFGALVSMIAHAAGESFYALAIPRVTFSDRTMPSGCGTSMPSGGGLGPYSSVSEQQVFSLQVGGSIPSTGSHFDPSQTIAVVLGARNEGRLLKLERQLQAANIEHVAIREVDGEHAGQLMAIGLVPGTKARLYPFVREFHMYRDFEAMQVPQ